MGVAAGVAVGVAVGVPWCARRGHSNARDSGRSGAKCPVCCRCFARLLLPGSPHTVPLQMRMWLIPAVLCRFSLWSLGPGPAGAGGSVGSAAVGAALALPLLQPPALHTPWVGNTPGS